MALETTPFDAAEYLTTPGRIAAYLEAIFEEGDAAEIRAGLDTVARAKGMSQLERETGLKRESLYKALSAKGNPTLDTMTRLLNALGLRLAVAPVKPAVSA